jgi:hypothetical protein
VDVLKPRSIIAVAHIRAVTAAHRIKPARALPLRLAACRRQALHFSTWRFCSDKRDQLDRRISLAYNSPAVFRIEEVDEARVRGERKSVAGLHCEAPAE